MALTYSQIKIILKKRGEIFTNNADGFNGDSTTDPNAFLVDPNKRLFPVIGSNAIGITEIILLAVIAVLLGIILYKQKN